MNYLPYLTFALWLDAWNAPKCSIDLIYQKVDALAKKNRINYDHRKTIREEACCYIVEYWPKDSTTLGGGLKAIVCKEDCKITHYKLYQ